MTPRRIVGALLASCVVAATAWAQDPEPAAGAPSFADLIRQARAAHDERKFDRARELYRQALALQPDSVEAREGQAANENDHYWYGQSPVEFRIPVRENWQHGGLSRNRNPVLQSLDPRFGARGGALGTGQLGYRHIASVGTTEAGSMQLTDLRAGHAAGPSGMAGRRTAGGGPIISTVPGERGDTGPTITHIGGYQGGGDRGGFNRSGGGPGAPVRGAPRFGGGGEGSRSTGPSRVRDTVGDTGIAAAFLSVVLPYVYDYAVPLDLTLEPLASTRAAGYSAMFGFAPMRGAAVMDEGLWKVGLTYSNWFGTMDKEGVFLDPVTTGCAAVPPPGGCPGNAAPVPANGSFYRYRDNRFDEGLILVEYGLGWGVELSTGLSFASLKEGHSGADRNEITFNRDGYVHVAEVDRAAGIGNLYLGARWGMPWGGEGDLLSGFGAALDLKIPLGDPDNFVTSGTFDAALTAILTQIVVPGETPLYAHLNVGLMMPFGEDGFFEHPPAANMTPAPPLDDEVDARMALYWGLGVSWKFTQHIVLLVNFEGNASPYDAGSDNPGGLGSGSFGVADGLTFTGHLGLRVLFDKLFFEGSLGHNLMVGDVDGMTGRISIALFFGGGSGGSGGRPQPGFGSAR